MYQESLHKFRSSILTGANAAITDDSVYNRSKIVREKRVALFPSTSGYEHHNGKFAAGFLCATAGTIGGTA
jgi:hypothetical protein